MRLTPVLSSLGLLAQGLSRFLLSAVSLSALGLAGAAGLWAQVPLMHKVQPESGRIGSVLRVDGVALGRAKVDEVYLSDHTFDLKVKVLNQTDGFIEFRIPPFVKPGRLQLVLKTTGQDPLVLEQPVYVTVDEPKAPKPNMQAANTTAPPAAHGTK